MRVYSDSHHIDKKENCILIHILGTLSNTVLFNSWNRIEIRKQYCLSRNTGNFENFQQLLYFLFFSQMNSVILTLLLVCLFVTFSDAGKWKISGKLSYSGYKGWGGSVGVSFSWRKKRRSAVGVYWRIHKINSRILQYELLLSQLLVYNINCILKCYLFINLK